MGSTRKSGQVPQAGDPEAQVTNVQTFRELLDEGFKGQHLDTLPQPPARPEADERLPNTEEVRWALADARASKPAGAWLSARD